MKQTLVRGQDARDFTVRVKHLKTGKTVGTGFVVSADGKIVTCAHVVVAAGVIPISGKRIPSYWKLAIESLGIKSTKDIEPSDYVGIYFPQLAQDKLKKARVVTAISDAEDDVVLLQLVDGPSPLGPDKVAHLGAAVDSPGHGFNTFGYRRLGQYQGLPGLGTIVGLVEKPEDRELQYERLMLTSQNIDSGMSGAAVLDRERNLVVGVIAETPDAIKNFPDRDTSFAVDMLAFHSPLFNLPFHDGPWGPGPSPLPPPEPLAASPQAPPNPVRWNNAPQPLDGFVGRDDMLAALAADSERPNCYLSSVIGFGGEGKSSLLRRWADNLLGDSSVPHPDGVFWWTFSTIDSADQFFEAAVKYVAGSSIDSLELLSSSARAHFIAARLYQHRFIFILDGLEALQEQQGDRFGELTNSALRELLIYFANGEHKSFGLLASRVPLVELLSYSTHSVHELTGLSADEGVELLQNLGVKGPSQAVREIVEEWDGHPLTLTLLSTQLVELYRGEVGHSEIPHPAADAPHREFVSAVLDPYLPHLSPAEVNFLCVFSLFRKSIPENAFPIVFRKEATGSLRGPLAALSLEDFQSLVNHLVNYRLLRIETNRKDFTTHPQIRSYFHSRIEMSHSAEVPEVQRDIAGFYLDCYTSQGEPPWLPSLEEMKPLFEAIHHACAGGLYDQAWRVKVDLVDRGQQSVLIQKLGASDTGLELLREFFPGGDTSKDPMVSDLSTRGAILNGVAARLQDLGKLRESLPFIERTLQITRPLIEVANVAQDQKNLSEIQAFLGMLDASAESARQAIDWASDAKEPLLLSQAISNLAWAKYLQGKQSEARENFRAAEELSAKIYKRPYLYTLSGFWYARFLERQGEIALAREVAEQNVQFAEQQALKRFLSRFHSLLASLDLAENQLDSAEQHLEVALRNARAISYRPALMDALLGRGNWAVRAGRQETAENDLNEALTYAVSGGYRIYEADARVALAFMLLASGQTAPAAVEAERAGQMSLEMNYHWGQVDSARILEAVALPVAAAAVC